MSALPAACFSIRSVALGGEGNKRGKNTQCVANMNKECRTEKRWAISALSSCRVGRRRS